MPQDPRLTAALQESRRATSEATAALQQMATKLRASHEQFKKDAAQRRSEFAKMARAGELGPEVRRTQQRVDLGETTWEDVAAGRDDDPNAALARQNVTRNLADLREQLADDPEFRELDQAAREAQRGARRDLDQP